MSIFYNTLVPILGQNAIVIKRTERGMRKVDQTSDSVLYKKDGKYFVKFK